MTQALRGINLGGWLVAERWMTPQLFQGVKGDGEIALVRELGYEEARRRLEKHRSSFITEQDFARIARHGFAFVRLPVGYWLFEETDDFIDGEHYVRQAFVWAERHGLGVVLDFHGLQGSQNGLDHSGQVGRVRFYRRDNRRAALRTLRYLCETYGTEKALLAMEIINEPKDYWFLWRLFRFYDRALSLAVGCLPGTVKIIVSDAFQPLRAARKLARLGYGERVVLDVHLYQVFSDRDQALSFEQHIEMVKGEWVPLLRELSGYVPVFVGEWSGALPPRADAPGRSAAFAAEQERAFASTTWAHSYWSYKAPSAGAWDYQQLTEL